MRKHFSPGKRVRINPLSCSLCGGQQGNGGSEFRVCSQHGAMVEHDMAQNTALGKVAARLSKVEAIIEPIPELLGKIDKALGNLKTDRNKIFAFAAGVSMAVTAIFLGAYYVGTALAGLLPWADKLKSLISKGG